MVHPELTLENGPVKNKICGVLYQYWIK